MNSAQLVARALLFFTGETVKSGGGHSGLPTHTSGLRAEIETVGFGDTFIEGSESETDQRSEVVEIQPGV